MFQAHEQVLPWDEVAGQFAWTALLIGNGASCVVSPSFAYPSLYSTACSGPIDHPLDDSDQALFDAMQSHDFERVLSGLSTASLVGAALGHDTTEIDARHASIKIALIQAVKAVHIAWDAVPEATLENFAVALRFYRSVYTTNYDLLSYWARARHMAWFADYFWGQNHSFDPAQTIVEPDRTRHLSLHGGLHLVRRAGVEYKRVHNGQNLLQQFGTEYAEPLFVSEGSSEEKLAVIHSSGYLAFAYHELVTETDGVVIFGHALAPGDEHIARAINRPGLPIAISLRTDKPPGELAERIAYYRHRLSATEPLFFDAASHPLG